MGLFFNKVFILKQLLVDPITTGIAYNQG